MALVCIVLTIRARCLLLQTLGCWLLLLVFAVGASVNVWHFLAPWIWVFSTEGSGAKPGAHLVGGHH